MSYNSPCQEDAHYYLLTETDPATGLPAWSMVQGNNLYNIAKTDLHHYQMISRDEARNQYLAEGRRVVRMTRESIMMKKRKELSVRRAACLFSGCDTDDQTWREMDLKYLCHAAMSDQ